MNDPFPVKKREELLRQRIEQMRRSDQRHLFQDFSHVRPTQRRPPPGLAASAPTIGRATQSALEIAGREGEIVRHAPTEFTE